MKLSKLFLITYTLILSIQINAQDWIEQMQSPNNYTFEEIQASFNQYWEGKEIKKGNGYKQFKRWENYWEYRRMPDGSFPPSNFVNKEITRFERSSKRRSRMTPMSYWTTIGPSKTAGSTGGIGRIASIGFHPTDLNKIYVGAAGGGLWQSNNGGDNWFTNTDDLATLGVSGIVVDKINPDIIYIATGDADFADNYSVGVLKSIDGGLTFNPTGLSWNLSSGNLIKRLIVDPNDNNTLIAATTLGIYRTTNAGTSWTLEASGSFTDVRPNYGTSSNIFYATTSTGVYRSTDNGDSWTLQFTISNSNRLVIATSPSNTNYLYVLSSGTGLGFNGSGGFNGLYRSTNSGVNFSLMSSSPNILGVEANGVGSGGQGAYDLSLAIDPSNINTIYIGGINTWKSTNGGSSWLLKSYWYSAPGVQTVHADKHVHEFQGNTLWEGNDGGLFKTVNGGDNWTKLSNGLVISQIYKLGVSQVDRKVICGLQDNGTKIKSTLGVWKDAFSSDGMECAIDPFDSQVMYGEVYYGEMLRSVDGGVNWTLLSGTPPGAWITPFELDITHPDTIVLGENDVWRSFNRGSTWTKISNSLSASDLRYLKISESNSNYIYTGTGNTLYRTINGGISWQTMVVPGSSTVMIEIDPTNPNHIFAVRSNYIAGQKVYESFNGGSTWTNISFNLPNIPISCIEFEKGSNNGIYIGSDAGVFYTENNQNSWELFSDNLPNVEVTELDINYNEGVIYASTYGRGLWQCDLHDPNPCFFANNLSLDSLTFGSASFSWSSPSTNPVGYEYTISTSPTFPTSGVFTTGTSALLSGLNYSNEYYFHLRSDCGGGSFSNWLIYGPFKPLPTCNDDIYDTGGATNDYENEEDYSITICPDTPSQKIKITFLSIDVEAEWDALYIHDGEDITAPIFNSGNPQTISYFPAGGYYGTVSPGPFTSTHSSGCLTLHFLSDNFTTGNGWKIETTCLQDCSQTIVNTKQDYISGSLRNVLDCASSGSVINFDIALIGDTLNILEPLIIDDKYFIIASDSIFLKSTTNAPIFDINLNGDLFLDNLNFLPMPGSIPMINYGILVINRATIANNNNIFTNNGTLIVQRNGFFHYKED